MYSLFCQLENEQHRFKTTYEDEDKDKCIEKNLAEKWLAGSYSLDADDVYLRSGLKRYMNLGQWIQFCKGHTDDDLSKETKWIEHEVSAYCIYSSHIYYIERELISKKDYQRWLKLLEELCYLPSQYGLIMNLNEHEDFMEVFRCLDSSKISNPKTLVVLYRD